MVRIMLVKTEEKWKVAGENMGFVKLRVLEHSMYVLILT